MNMIRYAYRRLHGRRIRLLPEELRQRLKGSSVVNHAGIRIYIDPSDRRGRRVFTEGGAADWNAVRLWQRLVEMHQPTDIIDVGANYGEVGLSQKYEPGTQVHLIEANPKVARFLARSVEGLSDATLHVCAASDRSGVLRLYRMGAISSGVSSTRAQTHAESTIDVPATTVDRLVVTDPDDRICFKIDVEGAEVSVLKGMPKILGENRWIGMLEYSHLEPKDLEWLRGHFTLSVLDAETNEPVPFPNIDLSSEERRRLGIGKDLIISPKLEASAR